MPTFDPSKRNERIRHFWTTHAIDQLAAIWNAGHDPQVTRAAATIDAELSRTPSTKGTEVAEGLRRLRVYPLAVLFEVKEPEREVEVVAVRSVRGSFNGSP